MAKDKPTFDPSDVAGVAGRVESKTREALDLRPRRSKRGVDPENYSQICFKVPKDKHYDLKVYCLQNKVEIGEAMERALDWLLSTGSRS